MQLSVAVTQHVYRKCDESYILGVCVTCLLGFTHQLTYATCSDNVLASVAYGWLRKPMNCRSNTSTSSEDNLRLATSNLKLSLLLVTYCCGSVYPTVSNPCQNVCDCTLHVSVGAWTLGVCLMYPFTPPVGCSSVGLLCHCNKDLHSSVQTS